ncbi:hypothetical protein EDD36DRAFT_197865 [Exophiala viscosa]|uniref:Serine-rich protein n=1 Tax=Exophiala viscosa TaxID=2486360 RepID=A0AAN6IG60_9EURO|nr:hypothetical protein EDD36DRAFT_197865 [Exophiala viscosa]
MSSSPSSVKSRPPKRTSPARTPLRERTQSQANEFSARLSKDALSDQENFSIYNTTPFPTKAAHVLLPSSIKKKKSTRNFDGDVFTDSPFANETGRTNEAQRTVRGVAQPTVRLKRSVKALRDLYEAQADEASRPSTAASPPLRPSTANSSRLRAVGSNESLSGPYAWDNARKISSDDLALLPTLPQGGRFANRRSSRASFTSIAERFAATSSPNYRVLGVTSSPRPPADLYSSGLGSSTADPSISTVQNSSSSPNVVRLAHTSSTEQFQDDVQSSSPNVIKLGTSSPFGSRPAAIHFATTLTRRSSDSSPKRKRSDTLESGSFADRAGARNPLASSPPVDRYIPTSAAASNVSPESRGFASSAGESIRQVEGSFDDSSPIVRRLGVYQVSSDDYSLAESHASLQAALSSSPPRIQYPVVRAPPRSQQVGLMVPKRNSRSLSRSLSAGTAGPELPSRLSAIPSEAANTRPTSVSSSVLDEIDEYLTSDELAPASMYIINAPCIKSQIRIVRDDDSDSHEAADEVSALPSSDDVYKSPTTRTSRSGSYVGSIDSSLSRLTPMRSSKHLRRNSSLSPSLRPTSSGSAVAPAPPLPTWAKRYYSGAYAESFQYLYASTSHVNLQNLASTGRGQRTLPAPSRPTTARSNGSPTRRGFHQAVTDRMEALFKGRSRPRLEARKSHTLPGEGPLVSNPLRGPATAAIDTRRQSYPSTHHSSTHGRSFSAPLSPVDPRSHWAGVIEINEQPLEVGPGSTYTIHQHHYRRPSYDYSVTPSESQMSVVHYSGAQIRRSWPASPHLHHDQRLNTGSSASRGFGFPFNARSRWTAPSIMSQSGGFFSRRADLRSAQVACFAVGFVVPFTWFIAAFLPLPKRPASYADLEKNAYSQAAIERRQSQRYSSQPEGGLSDWEEMDVLARLRIERHTAGVAELKWQHARWWRNLNRWMCAVGLVVCILVVVLAVLGTKRIW